MLNYLVRLGWSHGDQEIFSIEEMIELFDIAEVNQSASAFNPEKLLWLNQQHIIAAHRRTDRQALVPYLEQAGTGSRKWACARTWPRASESALRPCCKWQPALATAIEDFDEIDAKAAKKNLRPVVLEPLRVIRQRLASLPRSGTKEGIAETIEQVAASFEINMGKLGQPIRVAVTGGSVSPPIDVTVWLVGREFRSGLERRSNLSPDRGAAAST